MVPNTFPHELAAANLWGTPFQPFQVAFPRTSSLTFRAPPPVLVFPVQKVALKPLGSRHLLLVFCLAPMMDGLGFRFQVPGPCKPMPIYWASPKCYGLGGV